MPALDLALGLWMEERAAHMAHPPGVDMLRQLACDVAGIVVAEQSGQPTRNILSIVWSAACVLEGTRRAPKTSMNNWDWANP